MIDPRNWSPGKMVLALLGALLLAAGVFQGLGSLAAREPGTSKKKGVETSSTRKPLRPTLERVDDWTILISLHQSTPATCRLRAQPDGFALSVLWG